MFDSTELQQLLESELSNGNVISEATDWPPKCKNLIILKKKFRKKYEFKNLEYLLINDRHYWYAEYNSTNGLECLACGFK